MINSFDSGTGSEGLFPLGRIFATPGALAVLGPEDILLALHRHAAGDWGDVGEEDKKANQAALKDGARLLSAYVSRAGVSFWVITEADRSVTTVLLPGEY